MRSIFFLSRNVFIELFLWWAFLAVFCDIVLLWIWEVDDPGSFECFIEGFNFLKFNNFICDEVLLKSVNPPLTTLKQHLELFWLFRYCCCCKGELTYPELLLALLLLLIFILILENKFSSFSVFSNFLERTDIFSFNLLSAFSFSVHKKNLWKIKTTSYFQMGRHIGIEPMHTRATIWRVNHFTNDAIKN